MLSTTKRFLPEAIKSRIRSHWQDRTARKAFRAARAQGFSDVTLETLRCAWGNIGFSADCDYLCAVHDYAKRAKLAILECGSGLTTALMAAVASVPIYSLEHSPEWAQFIDRRLSQLNLSAVIVRTNLRDYGGFEWYEIAIQLPHSFDLVVCDGPPGTTRGGRYGLLPILGRSIRHAAILLDDAERKGESQVLRRWESEFGISLARHPSGYAFRPVEYQ